MATSFTRIRISTDARAAVDGLLRRAASSSDQAKVKELLVRAAEENGDRYLTAAEVKAVTDAFDAAPDFGAALDLSASAVESLGRASNVDGVSVHFTFVDRLSQELCDQLYQVAAKANGRPVEIDMMIFEFQSDQVGAAIADIARTHPNVTFRVVADSGQASDVGGNELPKLLRLGLPNVQVKYKKDFPYTWSDSKKAPVYNHNATLGLNHHKGFAATIDGVPDRVVTGSFNWSDTADTKNYEDLVVVQAKDASTRRATAQYVDEFRGFFNDDGTTLSPNNFAAWKADQWNRMVTAHGGAPRHFTPKPDDDYADYVPRSDTRYFDVNGLRPEDTKRLEALVGKSVASALRGERSRYGRFASFEELQARVPQVASLSAEVKAQLSALGSYGSMRVSINDASMEELDAAGFSKDMARAIVSFREAHGDFEAVRDLLKVPGMTQGKLNLAARYLEDDDVEAFFNSRPFGAAQGGTGYGAESSGRNTVAMGEDGTVGPVRASVTAAATDLFFRAQPGQRIDVAMYGMSTTAPEYLALVGAARRGVNVRVVLNGDYTESTVRALKALRSQGLPIDVRVQTAKTMHEKFGVVGDDVFFGSANFSESSSTKHSEDRFVLKNNEEVSTAFRSQFEELWAKSRIQ